ncbi:long-chain-fatty-acid--CoA ligase [Pontibacillus yanchengensis]|uniref:Long-chain-fatty-acid--CoA ligase n=1 Tax=Pontibacillus yanchengensis TaxID=462910 RepID=A0ACC7VH30_9BACI|nr:long-chain-fatty-acid--CoA ligase [Pontibacillus yanchengensis]MYL54072.1 long-chain-fatty-acid--CoA ligase [Pontibacillus yanchengensis]
MNISEVLAMQARRHPMHEAIVSNAERLTYEEWDETVNRLASGLAAYGIDQGDKVVLHMPNVKEFLFTYFAVQRLGALIVPINAKLAQDEIEYIIDHSDAKAFITHELLFNQVSGIEGTNVICIKTGAALKGWYAFQDVLNQGSEQAIISPLHEDDEAAILYTSGTTGRPKGVVFTNRNILTVATMICIEMTMNKNSRVLHMMPLSHSAPLHLFMVSATYVGATHVLAPTFTPDLLLDLVSTEKTTHFFGAPVAYLMTAKHPSIQEYDLSSMEYWVYGGAPLGTKEVEFVKQQFKTDRLTCVYGLTEAGPNGTLLLPEEHDSKAGSIGQRPALNCEVAIVDENGDYVPYGQVGEIVLRGEGNMKGYYKDEEKTLATFKDGWLYTGDMGKRDEDGFIWVIDRKKDVIIAGGVNIFPKEIEEVLSTHPAIAEVAVIGVPHPDWGETVKAFVVVEDDHQFASLEQDCKRFLEEKVANFKIPRIYHKLDALPRNATGKLLKQQLRQTQQSPEGEIR